ncbi:uncharacterized protein LOC143882253 isoform X4 [Tasmannia lanceolata]|uniref:uncharacterized protein LOC143882253 isoform X4 n=1 Tax=Tasmannia lanceolata TaxID=3420 RepID=UPI004062A938
MASLIATSSPNSFQLRLGFKSKKSSFVLLRMNFRNLDYRRISVCSASGSAARDEGESWMNSDASDSFSGWFDKDSGNGLSPKRGFGGIVGVGLAGVFLAAGVAFASLSFSKRSTAGPKLQMEPLTIQQEVLPATEDWDENVDQLEKEGNTVLLDEGNQQNGCDSKCNTALQVPPGKVVVPAIVDQVQGQAFAALQVLKVIEPDVQPSDLCTRREYARWLLCASSVLSRSTISKVYPAMFIENVTELAFDDVTPEDPDFPFIQGLAEAGLISSKLSINDAHHSQDKEHNPILFSPESPLSRQDLISWKMALEKRQLPDADRKILYQCSGFIDIDKINPDAWPALVADLSAGEHGITALAFGYTRLFQPDKPVTKAQAAIALATGDATEVVGEELTRIEAESIAETAVAAHTALVAQVEKDLNASFEKELLIEREKIDAIEKLAEEARLELERLRAESEEENDALMRGRAAVESEMEVLSRLRVEVEEQLQSLMSNKMEISFERDRINKLRKEAENENQVIAQLQYDLEVERKALSMARTWAEDEAKRAREQAKALEEARERWERHGLKIVVDEELRDYAYAGVTWVEAGKPSPIDGTVNRAEKLVVKLKAMSSEIKGKSFSMAGEIKEKSASMAGEIKEKSTAMAGEIKGRSFSIIEKIIQKIEYLISVMKQQVAEAARQARDLQSTIALKASRSAEEFQENAINFGSNVKDGAKRIAEDCREGVEKITQKFKT